MKRNPFLSILIGMDFTKYNSKFFLTLMNNIRLKLRKNMEVDRVEIHS